MSASTFGVALGKAVSGKRRRTRVNEGLWGAGTVLVVLLLWELLSRTGVLPGIAFPAASAVLVQLVVLFSTAAFWAALGSTLTGAGIGLAIVLVIGLPLG